MSEVVLRGCRPEPLAHYLMAVGVLRVVSKAEPRTGGFWRGDHFVLSGPRDRRDIERFLLHQYRPTPLVAPWNGGSGFFPKDQKAGINALRRSRAPRFAPYREAILEADRLLDQLRVREKPKTKEQKKTLIQACRAWLPDAALEWLDAAVILTGAGLDFPPLLGTGGNDGRLEFSNNFTQRLVWLFDPATGDPKPDAAALLAAALFGEPVDLLQNKVAVGQFDPGAVGGANATSDFDADSLVNPWEYVLMLEGAVLFAAAAAKRLEHDTSGGLSSPFTVRSVASGYGSAAQEEEGKSRGEIWVPLWSRPASIREVRSLLAEGRAHVGGRPVVTGLDFARAVATLGVDRGIDAFVRYGFLVRNGRSYLATPLGRFRVRRSRAVTYLQEIDAWLRVLRSRARSAPSSVRHALSGLETAILALCERSDATRLLAVLLALGQCESALARSLRWTLDAKVQPVPCLSPEWLTEADDGSVEFRLAASLASVSGRYMAEEGRATTVPLRAQVEPVATVFEGQGLRARWKKMEEAERDVVWSGLDLVEDLHRVMARRLWMTMQRSAPREDPEGRLSYADTGRVAADLADVAAFIEGRVDDARIGRLVWACCLLDWPRITGRPLRGASGRDVLPGGLYGLLKLCFAGRRVRDVAVPIVPRIHRLASAGRAGVAARAAARRLRASGLPPALDSLYLDSRQARRTAAALLFPLNDQSIHELADRSLRPAEEQTLTPSAAAAANT